MRLDAALLAGASAGDRLGLRRRGGVKDQPASEGATTQISHRGHPLDMSKGLSPGGI